MNINKSLMPKNSLCAWLFRVGKEASQTTEASFEPDMDLVYEMTDRKIRVQELLDCFLAGAVTPEIAELINWYETTRHLPASPAANVPSP